MLSWQDQYSLAQNLASDSDSDILTWLKQMINVGMHKLEKKLGIYYTEETFSFATVTDAISGTSDQGYRLPQDFGTFTELYVTVGSNQYWADLIQDPDLWRRLNSTTTSSTSDFLQNCYIRKNRIDLWPIPSSANTATLWYNAMGRDMSQDDYTTGTITTLANGSAAVTGSSTAWTSKMAGRYFKINDSTEKSDWYRISSVASATSLTLENEFQGTAISAGTSSYVIGEMPRTPPDTHIVPVYYALWKYYEFKKDITMAKAFKNDWQEGVAEALADWGDISSSGVVQDRLNIRRGNIINPNYYPEGMA